MSPEPKPLISDADRALQARLRQAAVAILIAGLLASGLVDWHAIRGGGDPYERAISNTRRTDYEMEMIAGKANIFASDAREWLASLWHGKRLAHLLAIVAVGGSSACFFVAHRLGFPPPAARRVPRKNP